MDPSVKDTPPDEVSVKDSGEEMDIKINAPENLFVDVEADEARSQSDRSEAEHVSLKDDSGESTRSTEHL